MIESNVLDLPTTFNERDPQADVETFLCGTNFLRDEEIRFLLDYNEIRTFRKGTHLLRAGQVANICFQNYRGIVREYRLSDDGEEHTTEFYTEGQSLTDSSSSISRRPVNHFWECLEDCTLSLFPYEMEVEMYRRFPRLETMCRIEMEHQMRQLREKMAFLLNSSPEQRYLRLLNSRPDLLNRVPQYQLASYIGVKPESLSRIRGRLRANVY